MSIQVAIAVTGSGTAADPYQITNCTELQNISNMDLYAYYDLNNNIDCSDTVNWNGGEGFVPIGGTFRGHFNGDNHTITGLYINRSGGSNGLFSTAGNASVSNFTARNWYIASDGNNCGFIAGQIYATGSPSSINQYNYVHDINIYDSQIYCGYSGSVTGYVYCTLNIAGRPEVHIYNITADNITLGPKRNSSCNMLDSGCPALMGQAVGGMIGYFAQQQQCTLNLLTIDFNGDITTGNYAGGLIGYYIIGEPSLFFYDYANMNIVRIRGSITSAIGYAGGTFGYVYFRGHSQGSPASYFRPKNILSNVSVTGTNHVGGMVGQIAGDEIGILRMPFEDTYSVGLVSSHQASGETISNIGGWVGNITSTLYPAINDCFWDINTSNQTISDGGIGRTSIQMKDNGTYENFSTTIWNITNGSYPYLFAFPPPTISEEEIEESEVPYTGGGPDKHWNEYLKDGENITQPIIPIIEIVDIQMNWWERLIKWLSEEWTTPWNEVEWDV